MFCAVYFRNLLFVAKMIPWFSKTWSNPQGFFFFLIGHVAFGRARPGFVEWGLLNVYVLTAGRGHASFLEMLIFNEL